LAHRVLLAHEHLGQPDADGAQGTGGGQHYPQALQGQHQGLGIAQQGKLGVNNRGPCVNTHVARHGRPPGIVGVGGDP
jgi:hypothetical protein